MELETVVAVDSLGFAMLVILLISSRNSRLRGLNSDKIFTSIIVITAISCVVELLSFIVDKKPTFFASILNIGTNSFLYLANIVDSYLWCIYVDQRLFGNKHNAKKLYPILALPALGGLLELFLNFKFNFLFSFDTNNAYHREPFGYSHLIITGIYLGLSVCIKAAHYRKYGKIRFFPIWIFLIPVILGALAQIFCYGISLVWCCVALGLIGMHMSLQNELAYVDPLTKLYNRTYLNFIVANMSNKYNTVGGIMLDMDYFKSINDTYGHEAGDNALSDISSIIRKSIPDKTIPIRFAGDEFIIFCPEYDEAKMDEIIGKLRYEVSQFNKTGIRPYVLSFSAGVSTLVRFSDTDYFLRQLDEKMYEEKKLKHHR